MLIIKSIKTRQRWYFPSLSTIINDVISVIVLIDSFRRLPPFQLIEIESPTRPLSYQFPLFLVGSSNGEHRGREKKKPTNQHHHFQTSFIIAASIDSPESDSKSVSLCDTNRSHPLPFYLSFAEYSRFFRFCSFWVFFALWSTLRWRDVDRCFMIGCRWLLCLAVSLCLLAGMIPSVYAFDLCCWILVSAWFAEKV